MTKTNVLILGATSDVAVALAARFAANKYAITLAGRDDRKLNIIATDLRIRYQADVLTIYFDALLFDSHEKFYQNLLYKPEIVVCVFGFLGNQHRAQTDWHHCQEILDSNYTGAVSILNIVASDFEKRQTGVLVGISSVAGDRGRQSNYIYGSAKAGFTAYLSGLRNRLFKSNVHVMTVKPGFMKTKMLEGMKTPASLTVSPDAAAKRIFKGIRAKKNVLYVLPIWRWVMLVIVLIPEAIFKKLKL